MTVQKKILIIDDGKENVAFFDIVLTRYGYTIFCAGTVDAGLELIKTDEPDIVLLDGTLAAAADWYFLKTLKSDAEFKKWKNTPVIVFSASESVQVKYQAIQLGAMDFITKPFSFEDILMKLRVFFEEQEKQKYSVITEWTVKNLLYELLDDIDVIVDSSRDCSAEDLKKLKEKYAEKLDKIDISYIKSLEHDKET